jgi:hypothetical protein
MIHFRLKVADRANQVLCISHPTINTRDVAVFVPFRRGLGCGSATPPLQVLVHRLMGRSMGLGYEHPVRSCFQSFQHWLWIDRRRNSLKMLVRRWIYTVRHSIPGRTRSILGLGRVLCHPWDMQNISFKGNVLHSVAD